MSHGRFHNPVQATLTGLKDLVGKQPLAERLTDDLRLDGQTALVTGATSGLGFAIAVQLAQRGARVLALGRSASAEKVEDIRRLAGSDDVEIFKVDLSDLEQVRDFARTLRERNEKIDVVVENAGVASPKAKKTPQDLEAMFVTNYVAKFYLLNLLLDAGTIPNRTRADNQIDSGPTPRILFISSDSHQGASAIDWDEFGTYAQFGVNGAINNYSYFKLVMNTFATELSRRLNPQSAVEVSVNVMCPGPVDSNIIREAPGPLRWFMRAMFKAFFRSPEAAAKPAVFMCVDPEFQEETNRYLHMWRPKDMDPKVYDATEAQKLWTRSEGLLESVGHGLPASRRQLTSPEP